MAKRQTLMDEHLNQVVWFGGLPIRRGDMMTYLTEVAQEQDYDNWLRIRDAGMLGNYQFNERHGYPPEGIEPLTLSEFRMIVGDIETAVPVKRRTVKQSKSRPKRRTDNPISVRGIRR